jgi:hypothetical protein
MEIDHSVTASDWKAVVSDPTLHQILDRFLAAPAMDLIAAARSVGFVCTVLATDPSSYLLYYTEQ